MRQHWRCALGASSFLCRSGVAWDVPAGLRHGNLFWRHDAGCVSVRPPGQLLGCYWRLLALSQERLPHRLPERHP